MDTFEISVDLQVSAAALYDAWLSSAEHSAFTGSNAEIDASVGGKFTAWDGYIDGETLELEPGKRIVQSWRTSEFAANVPASRIEVLFTDTDGGSKLTLIHSSLQPGDGEKYEQGWEESYFSPMRAYFAEKAS
ncbi:MAG: SRPBCC domain-containing protein [Chloroflexi bacterium]|nr:SRPBCC domain-containing protein [Chloroflexota bacterium]